MDYQLALAPDLSVSAHDFVTTWNAEPACRQVAEARVVAAAEVGYDAALVGSAVAVLGGVVLGVVSKALYDLIKQVLVRRGVHRRTTIVQHEQPDGSCLLVVTVVEE